MVIRDVCPQCQSPKFKKNSHIHKPTVSPLLIPVSSRNTFVITIASNEHPVLAGQFEEAKR